MSNHFGLCLKQETKELAAVTTDKCAKLQSNQPTNRKTVFTDKMSPNQISKHRRLKLGTINAVTLYFLQNIIHL